VLTSETTKRKTSDILKNVGYFSLIAYSLFDEIHATALRLAYDEPYAQSTEILLLSGRLMT